MQPTNALIARVQAGQAWVADTQIQQLSLAGFLRFKVANTGSVNAYVYSFGGQGSAATTMKVQTGISPTSLTNNIVPSNQNVASKMVSTMTLSYDTNATDFSGGTYFRSIPITTEFKIFNDNIILIPPGSVVTLSGSFLLNASGIFHLAWFEQPN